ncbi:DUF3375 domain-containing protein [Nocardioides cynanchi]|uniref:DUF3375 domain-containing protein n=1 Tax=Nocardioides cynanchi TaxID=2558918 RepID=UPI001245F589|nr:DUF3375 domain-containing protein [Nocardioides cynanchi]
MSDIPGELERVRGAFEQPTLTLLHQRQAPVIIAIFRSSFGRDTRFVPAARLHDQVDAYLTELRLAGLAELPSGAGRDLCLRWMRGRWLVRSTDETGAEVYSLTSHAQDALALVKSLTRERASLSEHRISTILSAVRRFNAEANPDPRARVEILDAEIARLTADRDRITQGAELTPVTPDYMLEGYTELLGLVAGLPSEFARVEEAFGRMRSDILASFRAESRSAGQVIDDYLERADRIQTATPEGRAFAGAFTLLRDEELLLQLREDLTALVSHPLAGEILLDHDRRELRGTVALIRRGIDDVLAQRSRVSATLREYIVTHDITRDRELDDTLRKLEAELDTWMETAGPRAHVPLPLLPARVDVKHLRERFHDPANELAPAPLQELADELPEALSLDELRRQGGPTLEALLGSLMAALTDPDARASLGAIFDALDTDMRRPVEILGLLHLATNYAELQQEPHADESYRAIRPDGTERDFVLPKLHPTLDNPDEPHAQIDPDAGGGAGTDASTDRDYSEVTAS